MFFYLSKILWFILEPANFFFFLFTLSTVFLWTPWRKAGVIICTIGCLFYGGIGFFPVGTYLVDLLESRFEKPSELPNDLKGIIILGGVVSINETIKTNELVLMNNRERVDVLKELSVQYPDVPIVFTSGSNSIDDQSVKEADLIRPYLNEITYKPDRLIFENQSRNTYENALFSKELVMPKSHENWLLITSAAHMPRSVGIFRKQGWLVTPYPVNFTVGSRFMYETTLKLRRGHVAFKSSLHEWLGLLAYYVTGKTSALLPAPQSN